MSMKPSKLLFNNILIFNEMIIKLLYLDLVESERVDWLFSLFKVYLLESMIQPLKTHIVNWWRSLYYKTLNKKEWTTRRKSLAYSIRFPRFSRVINNPLLHRP